MNCTSCGEKIWVEERVEQINTHDKDKGGHVLHLSRVTFVWWYYCQKCGKRSARTQSVAFDENGIGREVTLPPVDRAERARIEAESPCSCDESKQRCPRHGVAPWLRVTWPLGS